MTEAARELSIDLELPEKLGFLLTERARYKVAYGGRGSAKSWSYARALIWLAIAADGPERTLCARETQESIGESVHRLLVDQIELLGVSELFAVLRDRIVCIPTGAEFIFCGIRTDPRKIKSLERITRCWVEEAEAVSEESWEILIPTIREPGSEVWVTFNPRLVSDPTWQRFVVSPPANAIVVQVSWRDNPWFPSVLDAERRDLETRDPAMYRHVWEGECGVLGHAFFPVEALDHAARTVREPTARGVLEQAGTQVRFIPSDDGWLELWAEPDPSEQHYVAGGDVSEGLPHGDIHSGHILRRGLVAEQVARISPQAGPDEYGRCLVLACQYYGASVPLAIERNALGIAAVIAARDTGYEHIYRQQTDEAADTAKDSARLGWVTTATSRPVMLSDLSAALRDEALTVRSERTLEQLRSFVRSRSGKPEGMAGCLDDDVMGLAIAYQMLQRTEPIRTDTTRRHRKPRRRGTWMG